MGSRSPSRRARPCCRPRSRTASQSRITATTRRSASTVPAACASSRSRRCRSCRRRARRSAPRAWWSSTETPEVIEARAGVFEFLLREPPARLPGVRQGRRVPAPGFLVQLRSRREPDGVPAARVRRRRREGRRRLRTDAHAEPQPLHPVHAVRPVHERDRRRRADRRSSTAATAARSPRSRRKASTRCSRAT